MFYYFVQIILSIVILLISYRFNKSMMTYLLLFLALIATWIIIKSVNPQEIRLPAIIYDFRVEDIIFIAAGIILNIMSRRQKVFRKDPLE